MTKRREFLSKSIMATAGVAVSSMGYGKMTYESLVDNNSNVLQNQGKGDKNSQKPAKLSEAGWCWDGQGINGQWKLSIFGAGEGTRWFGLEKCCFMFHPNSPLAMEKMGGMKEIICDISKWDYHKVECQGYSGLGFPVAMKVDGRIERKKQEAKNISQLSVKYPNITGAFDDDLIQIVKRDNITPGQYASVNQDIKSVNPKMKHWIVVYSHELRKEDLLPYVNTFDIVTLWVWASKDLVNLDKYVEQCRQIFPDKPIYIGCYLRDYTLLEGISMTLLKHQWELVAKYVYENLIQGYHVLAGSLIDLHPEQAMWIRDFIKAN
jgi:hypothetical protein